MSSSNKMEGLSQIPHKNDKINTNIIAKNDTFLVTVLTDTRVIGKLPEKDGKADNQHPVKGRVTNKDSQTISTV
jgi:hypothetical protein